MKKTNTRKLALSKETLVSLAAGNLIGVAGAGSAASVCEICIYTVNWCVDTN
jgi:hypothetical protein